MVFNYRGCNGVPLTSPKGYSPVVTDDVYTVIDEIKWFNVVWDSMEGLCALCAGSILRRHCLQQRILLAV